MEFENINELAEQAGCEGESILALKVFATLFGMIEKNIFDYQNYSLRILDRGENFEWVRQ